MEVDSALLRIKWSSEPRSREVISSPGYFTLLSKSEQEIRDVRELAPLPSKPRGRATLRTQHGRAAQRLQAEA